MKTLKYIFWDSRIPENILAILWCLMFTIAILAPERIVTDRDLLKVIAIGVFAAFERLHQRTK